MTDQQLKDELAIRALADKFSDAANRKDGELFASLWAPDGEWVVGPPINVAFTGRAQMADSVLKMLGRWDFFVQLTTAGVVLIDGDTASARFYVQEVARAKGGGAGNFNLSMYEDELVRLQERWYFRRRTYHTIYQDAPALRGAVLEVPQLPEAIRRRTLN